jgi:hypothetical protein
MINLDRVPHEPPKAAKKCNYDKLAAQMEEEV